MDAEKTLVIRADAYAQIGLGHVMRCLALAQELEKRNVRPTFIIRDYDRKIKELIQRYEYNVETIPADCNWAEDLRLTLNITDRYGAKTIITDLSHAGTLTHQSEYGAYLQELKDKRKFLVTIDDLNEMSFPSDIVINPNCGAENGNYPSGGSTKFLLGPAYFIFRPEFIAAAGVKREITKEAVNVLVAMSGSDPLDFTGKVAGALAKSGKISGLHLRIVLGIDYTESRKRNLNKTLKNYPGTCELIQGGDKLAELMLWSDLVITGAGLTKYEAAVTGTPSIIIPQYDHLVKLAEKFARSGATLNLGLGDKLEDEAIAEAVARLLGDASLRAEMSRKGRALVDGRGIERIISEIPSEVWS
jgi:UDP-2,4-diacetamido-2,4,6-trideoxy-beta-L-altropyranose hydrolase